MATEPAKHEVREASWLAAGIVVLSGMVVVIVLIMITILLVAPPQQPTPHAWMAYVLLGIAVLGVIGGVMLQRKARVAIALFPDRIALPTLNASIPWSEVEDIEMLMMQAKGEGPVSTLLVMDLTNEGKKRIGGRPRSNTPLAAQLEGPPDICLKCNVWSYGPGISSHRDFETELRKRKAAATGAAAPLSTRLPPLDSPLAAREMSKTGANRRTYKHDICGSQIVVSDGSLAWLSNPLRYTGGSTQCTECGQAFDNTVTWTDTGESVARFRSRMWRHTPLWVKLTQFVAIPLLVGLLAMLIDSLIDFGAKGISPLVAAIGTFSMGFVLSNMAIYFTPLAGILPKIVGLEYEKYQ